jgi:hypothetical protein
MRVSRQWRDIKVRKWFGYGHDTDQEPGNGDLAFFCPACPQPGINLPDNWKDSPHPSVNLMIYVQKFCWNSIIHRWLYWRSLVVDGNFSAEHLHMKNPNDDVELTNGTGYFVERQRYQQHIKEAVEIRQVSPLVCCIVMQQNLHWSFLTEVNMFQAQGCVSGQCK